MMNKLFVPHELKTIEVDVEKKVFRINGEDFGKDCDGFSISCNAGNRQKWFEISVNLHADVQFANYDIHGEKTEEGQYQVKK